MPDLSDPTFWRNHWGDVASALGVVVSLAGFYLAISQIRSARTAAQRAEQAALRVKSNLLLVDVASEISSALATVDEIKRLHREGTWRILPDRYTSLRRSVVAIRSAPVGFSDDQQVTLQNVVQQFANLERQIEEIVANRVINPDAAKLNSIVGMTCVAFFGPVEA